MEWFTNPTTIKLMCNHSGIPLHSFFSCIVHGSVNERERVIGTSDRLLLAKEPSGSYQWNSSSFIGLTEKFSKYDRDEQIAPIIELELLECGPWWSSGMVLDSWNACM